MISSWFKFQSVWRKLVFLEAIPSQAGNLLRLKAVLLLILPRAGNIYEFLLLLCVLLQIGKEFEPYKQNTLCREGTAVATETDQHAEAYRLVLTSQL